MASLLSSSCRFHVLNVTKKSGRVSKYVSRRGGQSGWRRCWCIFLVVPAVSAGFPKTGRDGRHYRTLKMRRLAFEELASFCITYEFAIFRGDLSSHCYHAGAAFVCHSFECVVIEIHQMRLGGNLAFVIR